MGRLGVLLFLSMMAVRPAAAQVRLPDASDRAAFVAWFVLLADTQFQRPTSDVTDCAALVRHAVREALRPHTAEWRRSAALPVARSFPDVRVRPPQVNGGLALFRVSPGEPPAYGEFADARTIVRLNTRLVSRDAAAARPGDLLYFHQPAQRAPDHVMVFVGRSPVESTGNDWVVYHTGPDASATDPAVRAGEMRKVRLADLRRHPAARWRPLETNPRFLGVYRFDWL